MNQLPREKRARILHCLMEGMSLRAASRVNDVAFNTVLKFTTDIGKACERYQYHAFQDLKIDTIEADEIWSFIGTKEERKMDHQPEGWGSVYTWTAIDPRSRLMPVWHIGGRQASDAYMFIQKLRWAIKDQGKNLQICTDGNITYLPAIQEIFGTKCDYLQYYKVFHEADTPAYRRYSMPRMKTSARKVMIGNPDPTMCTNFIESSNMMIRTQSRRFVRMTNAHSKKLLNHRYAFATTMFFYNFARIHSGIRCTPAMEAGISDHVWKPSEMVALLEQTETKQAA